MKVKNADEVRQLVGATLPASPWTKVTQQMIDTFAEATMDKQWIHIDPEKAAKHSPFKKTVAHGFLSLALLSSMAKEVLTMESTTMGLNYGFNKIRFPHPVLVDSQVRLNATIKQVEDFGPTGAKGIKITWDCQVEIKGEDKPACVAEWITVLF